MSDEHLDNIKLPQFYSMNIDRTKDIECDQNGRILFSAPNSRETDSARTEIYIYDVLSGEIQQVIESLAYPRIVTPCCPQPGISIDENGLLYLVTTNVASLEIYNPELENILSS